MDTTTTAPRGGFSPFTPDVAAPNASPAAPAPVWPAWQRVLFRFFFVYFGLEAAPWNWFGAVPGEQYIRNFIFAANDKLVRAANAHVFHFRDTLVPVNGSGDTSFAWTQFYLYLSLAAIACVVWTVLDRRRVAYERLAWWLRLVVRYYIIGAALSYGIIKLFMLQMGFPTLSQLATPLGDFLPMRFAWMFIGYSNPYQIFSGAMETVAGLLLLYRRTVTAGLFAATGAFLNVVMINLAYDVPVKRYASHLLLACLFLLALDARRLTSFLFLNRGVSGTALYDPWFTRGWQRWAALGVKALMLWQMLVLPFQFTWTSFQTASHQTPRGPFRVGVYDVRHFVVNGDTIPLTSTDTLRWRDVIIDNDGAGSVNTGDQVFWQRYHRGYFRYKPDTAARTVAVWKISTIPRDSTFLFTMRYEVPDTATIRFATVIRGDSVRADLVRVPRHFQLTERQFHWLSEYNR